MTTISASGTVGINLNSGVYASPVVVEAGVTISNPNYPNAIYTDSSSTAVFTIQNYGTIIGIHNGVYLSSGGFITNAASGSVTSTSRVGYRGTDRASGVAISGGAGTVVNAGTISGAYYGVNLHAGGSVTNEVSGLLASGYGSHFPGVIIAGGDGTILNDGRINGVFLFAGGSVTNASGASIVGNEGVELFAAGTVVNDGVIAGSYGNGYGVGVALNAGGLFTNAASGSVTGVVGGVFLEFSAWTLVNNGNITAGIYGVKGGVYQNTGSGTLINNGNITGGTYGVNLTKGGTLTNAGTIIGNGGTAVIFGSNGTYSNRLVLEPGFGFSGLVTGSTSASNALELASAVSAGTVTGLGSQFLHFNSIVFDAGAKWSVAGVMRGLAGTISGFAAGDTIDLGGFVAASESFSNNALVLTNTLSQSVTLDVVGSFSTGSFAIVPDGSGGTDITVPCFCRGTRILTERGEVAVEGLKIGDKLTTRSGVARPIKWIGRRAYHPRFIAGNRRVLPFWIAAGALGEGVPARDLWISPEHALYLDGALVPVWLLANGATIRQAASVDRLEYFHIELETHDVIVAEGAPAETFVDCDNRGMFHNCHDFARRYPSAAPTPWEFCAPRAEDGSAELAGIRAALLARAETLGRVTRDPDLHLVCDGAILAPRLVGNSHPNGAQGRNRSPSIASRSAVAASRVYFFAVPAGARSVSIASRIALPAEAEASSQDGRCLGVAVERVILRDAGSRIVIGHDCPALSDGFHAAEGSHRRSNGRGWIPEALLASFGGTIFIEVHIAETGLRYRLDAAAGAASAKAIERDPR